MVVSRPLFGSRASVENVQDSFGNVVNLVKTREGGHTPSREDQDPPHAPSSTSADASTDAPSSTVGESLPSTNKDASLPPSASGSSSNTRKELDRQQEKDTDLGHLLKGAALASSRNDQSHPDDHDHETDQDDHTSPMSQLSALETQSNQTSDAADLDRVDNKQLEAWKLSGQQANVADQIDTTKTHGRLGSTFKKVDVKLRSTFGINAPASAKHHKSPYLVESDEHTSSHLSLGAAELLQEASMEHMAELEQDDDEDDDDEDDDEDGDEDDSDDDDVDKEDDANETDEAHGDERPSASNQQHAQQPQDTAASTASARLRSRTAKRKASLKKNADKAEHARTHPDQLHAGDNVRLEPAVKISSEQKLKAIIDEFGECASVSQPDVPEQLIADIPGVLVKTVLIKGSIFLTNRRLCFLAFIPVTKYNAPEHSSDQTGVHAPTDPNIENPILKAGPAILHRPGKMRPKRKVWLELRKHSLSAYPASNKLYKPLGTLRLAGLSSILPTDWSQPHVIRLIEGLKYSSIEFKTEEAALDWRKELEGASFHAHNTSEKVRISLPLDRIVNVDASAFMQFAKIMHIDILDGFVDSKHPLGSSEKHNRHSLENSWSSGSVVIDCPRNPEFRCHITKVSIGMTVSRMAFVDLVKDAVKIPMKQRLAVGHEELMRRSPAPLLDMNPDHDDEPHTNDPDSQDEVNKTLAEKFCKSFGLRSKPEDLKIVKAELWRTIPTHGTMAIDLDYLCFWRRAVGRGLKIKVPLNDIQGAEVFRTLLWHHHGLVVHITAHPDIFFEFVSKSNRDMVLETLKRVVEAKEQHKKDTDSVGLDHARTSSDDSHATKVEPLAAPMSPSHPLLHNLETDVPVLDASSINHLPKLVNVDHEIVKKSIRIPPMRIYCLTIGSRGDVQPYIALCKALKQHGHTTVIVSHPEYRSWVEGHGIEYRGVGGDPAALMKLSVEHRMFSPAFFRESIGKFRVWLDELLRECWEECQGAELLIESPSTMAGIHVAEGLGIPYFRAFTMPWTKTSAYPQAFSVPSLDMGPSYNSSSYVLFDQIMWVATSGQINRWRKHMVGIGPTDLTKLDTESIPFIYNFSPAVVPVPNDWGDRVKVSGYWFLDNPESNWKPPQEMEDFLSRARKDGKKIAYIGFGSITIDNAEEVSENINAAVRQADVRAIVAKGWSGRGGPSKKKKKKTPRRVASSQSQVAKVAGEDHEGDDTADEEEMHDPEIPEDVFVVDSVPHDWLFPKIDIAMHHGGAGTTGASLRAGLVTLIKPFFGDQFFWALRVQKLGAGARVNSLSTSDLADALKAAAQDRIMVEKAQGIGEKIRSEDGVATAIQFLYANISLAKRWTQRREASAAGGSSSPSTSPHSRFGSHGRSSSSSSTSALLGEYKSQHESTQRSSTMPPTPTTPSSGCRMSRGGSSLKAQTISESPEDEDGGKSPKRSSTLLSSMPSLPSLPSMPSFPSLPASNLASAFKEIVTLHSSTADTTADGEEIVSSPLSPDEGPKGLSELETHESKAETEDQRMARLKGYKNAKAEDIRRRKLLEQRLARERAEKEKAEKPSAHEGAATPAKPVLSVTTT